MGLLGPLLNSGLGGDIFVFWASASVASAVGGGGKALFKSLDVLDKLGDDTPYVDPRVIDVTGKASRATACGAFSVMSLP